jgi:hypothetical protein
MDIDIDKEFRLLEEYLKIYVQFLPIGSKNQIPSFEEFKSKLDIFRIPKFKERKYFIENRLVNDSAHGLGVNDENIFYRKYCIFRGVKFYPANNFNGNWSVNENKLQEKLKFNSMLLI